MESAVRDACEQLLKDPEIDKPSRKRRAEGIKRIGKYWKVIHPEVGKEGAWEYFAEMESQMKSEQSNGSIISKIIKLLLLLFVLLFILYLLLYYYYYYYYYYS